MKGRKGIYLIVLITFVALLYLFQPAQDQQVKDVYRDTAHLVYTKHAKCRMDCRDINEREIKEIIESGKLNKAKSGYDAAHQDETYALEGYSYQDQHIRVVVAPKNNELVIITVIDLDKDWACSC